MLEIRHMFSSASITYAFRFVTVAYRMIFCLTFYIHMVLRLYSTREHLSLVLLSFCPSVNGMDPFK